MVAMTVPGVNMVYVGDGCGPMLGGPPRVTHHTTEGGSIDGAVSTYLLTHDYPHLTGNYLTDEIVGHIPFNVGATALMHNQDPETNRMGTFNVQIEWIGAAANPFTDGHSAGPNVRRLFDTLRSLGIPDVWPAGPPPANAYGIDNGHRNAAIWSSRAGHYCHSQVPGNYHADPGAINPSFIRATAITSPGPQEDEMNTVIVGDGQSHYVTNFLTKRRIATVEEDNALRLAGMIQVSYPRGLVAAIKDQK